MLASSVAISWINLKYLFLCEADKYYSLARGGQCGCCCSAPWDLADCLTTALAPSLRGGGARGAGVRAGGARDTRCPSLASTRRGRARPAGVSVEPSCSHKRGVVTPCSINSVRCALFGAAVRRCGKCAVQQQGSRCAGQVRALHQEVVGQEGGIVFPELAEALGAEAGGGGGGGDTRRDSGKRGRRPGRKASLEKQDMRAKLERSRQSARECRARKKLRYQYLEELVADREKAVLALRKELDKLYRWNQELDAGRVPEGVDALVQELGVIKQE